MRIGIASIGETNARDGIKTAKIGEFRGVEIMEVVIGKRGGKRRFLRDLKRCALCFRKMGVSICAAGNDFKVLREFGITVFTSGERIFREHAGELALKFADYHKLNCDFVITGGRLCDVVDAATAILHRERYIYIENAAFEEISEVLYSSCGVVVGRNVTRNIIRLNLCDTEKLISGENGCTSICDFVVHLPGEHFLNVSENMIPPLVEILEISGVLQKREIKVEYLPKENL